MRAILAAAVFAFGATCPARAATSDESVLVLLSLAAGAQHVDLPRFDRVADDAGWCPQVGFALGVPAGDWLEPFAELSFAFLPGADSVRAVSGADTLFTDVGTLTQAQAGLALRWPGAGRLRPFVRAAAGVARWSEASPGRLEVRSTDALWSGGGGVEWRAHRHLVLRAEAMYSGQRASGSTRTHGSLLLRIGYAFTRDVLAP